MNSEDELREVLRIAAEGGSPAELVLARAKSRGRGRRRRPDRRLAIVAVVGILLVSGGASVIFGILRIDSNDGFTSSSTGPRLITHHSVDSPLAIIQGRLIQKGSCLFIGDSIAVFPEGSEWDAEGGAIWWPDHEHATSIGEPVKFGGGEIAVASDLTRIMAPGDIVSVNECAKDSGAVNLALATEYLDN